MTENKDVKKESSNQEISEKFSDFKRIPSGTIRLGLIEIQKEANSGQSMSLFELGDFAIQNKGFFNQQSWYTTLNTEENIGVDVNGRFYRRNESVVVVVQGKGLLVNQVLKLNSLEERLDLSNGSIKYSQEDFDNLLRGRLPSGQKIKLYDFMQAQAKSFAPEKNFGIILPYELAKETKSGIHSEKDLMRNILAIARAGGKNNLTKIYSAFAPVIPKDLYHQRFNLEEGLGNFHSLNDVIPSIPQGRLLYLVNSKYANKKLGIYGNVGFNEPANFIFSKS